MEREDKSMSRKIKKYFLYALGEVVLVVIGILIAVQMNNWNTNQHNIEQAEEYLQKISNELARDTAVFGNTIMHLDRIIEIKKFILNHQQLDSLPVEYLDGAMNTQYLNIKINDATFSGMKDPAILSLAEFDDIFDKVNRYYTYNQDYLDNFNDWEKSLATKESTFWEEQGEFEILLLSHSEDSIHIFQQPTERKANILSRMNSIQGRNFLKLSLHRYKSVKGVYTQTKQAAADLLIDIHGFE